MEPKSKYQNLRISDELLEDFKGRILDNYGKLIGRILTQISHCRSSQR